ncbi:MAG TPA: hypothetical protein PLX08_13225 [Bacteroidales bacterium]|jgi:hypothetical protein|nr:hypothetical protein [Bacteroidales bacterium]
MLLIIPLTCNRSDIFAQGWIFTFTVTSSGPCGSSLPYIPPFTVPYMPTQSFCESLRQQILAIRASTPVFDSNGKYIGDCSVFYTCSACTGSDMTIPGDNTAQPGSVSIDGLAQGTAFFTPHESKAIENWIDDYIQKMKSMGMDVYSNQPVNQDIPSTGQADFDKYYADQSIRFEKPEQGGVVDLSGGPGVMDLLQKQGEEAGKEDGKNEEEPQMVVPVMGSSPLTAEERERINAYNLKPIPDNRLDESNFRLEESPFWTTPEMLELGTDALNFTAGFVSGGYVAVAGVDVVSGIINKKSGQEILVDVAGDLLTKKIGDVAGNVIGKGGFSIGKVSVKTGVLSGEAAKKDFELVSGSADAAVQAWEKATGSN